MIINYMSDIHLEFGGYEEYEGPPDDADVIVIAGDLAPTTFAMRWLEETAQHFGKPIVYVPGNHEFYGANIFHWVDEFRRQCRDIGVDYLYNDTVLIKDTVFIGTTLFTNFDLTNAQRVKMGAAPTVMADYQNIHGCYGEITPKEVLDEHRYAVGFLCEKLAHYSDKKTCVVTHHAPSALSLPKDQRASKYASYYASNLDPLIKLYQPDLWVHGHVHETNQYFIGDTLVVSNPRGYVEEDDVNPKFDPYEMIKI